MKPFEKKLKNIIEDNLNNIYCKKLRIVPDLSDIITETKLIIPQPERRQLSSFEEAVNGINIRGLNNTYENLTDEYSENLFLNLLAYHLLGHTRITLPLSDKSKWLEIEKIEKKCKKEETLETEFWKLDLFDLSEIGYDIRMYFNIESIFIGIFLKEYAYDKDGVDFKVNKGDYVIDAGACYGDTALYFAHDTGETGKVFSFEFLQENLDVFERNMQLNPHLKSRIQLIEKPLWSESNRKLYIMENGPATYCSMTAQNENSSSVDTINIDDFVKDNKINKIDFIKMDIEGAELDALHGAARTIKQFKPKLAICLYHNFDHFISIPKYIKELVPEYKFYLDHHTMSVGETVLYATL